MLLYFYFVDYMPIIGRSYTIFFYCTSLEPNLWFLMQLACVWTADYAKTFCKGFCKSCTRDCVDYQFEKHGFGNHAAVLFSLLCAL